MTWLPKLTCSLLASTLFLACGDGGGLTGPTPSPPPPPVAPPNPPPPPPAAPVVRPDFLAVTQDGTSLYVSRSDSKTTVFKTDTHEVVTEIPRSGPVRMSRDGAFAYIYDWYGGTTSEIETTTHNVVREIAGEWYGRGAPVGDYRGGTLYKIGSKTTMGRTQSDRFYWERDLWVNVYETENFTRVDSIGLGTGEGSPTGFPLVGLYMTPDGTTVYVSDLIQEQTYAIDTRSNAIVDTIAFAGSGWAFSPDGSLAYGFKPLFDTRVAARLFVFSTTTNKVVDEVVLENGGSLAISPDGAFLYIADVSGEPLFSATSGTVSVIETSSNRLVNSIEVGVGPRSIAFTPDGDIAYVANNYSGTVSMIDTATQTVVDTIRF